jgi:Ca-activated chloride channel family protein
MSFAWPVMLLAVLLVPAGIWLAVLVDRRRRSRVADVTGSLGRTTPAGGAVGTGGLRSLDALPAVLVVAALGAMALALARPQATVALPRLEGTLMLVFDVSGSMAADDVAPTRLEAAKALATEIVDRRAEGVVIGVVAFSDAGVAVQAPTSDMVDVRASIGRLVPTRGTSLGAGILAAVTAIDEARAQTPAEYYSNRSPSPTPEVAVPPGSDAATVIVVLSDGENNEDPDPAEAANVAADRGIRIQALGVGTTAGATLDLDGFQVETRLDEAMLERLAGITAGSYAPAAEGDPAGVVYHELARDLVVREEPVELTAILAGLALVLLAAGVGLSLARSGRLP